VLVAYDDKLAFYTDGHCDSLTTVRRDKKKLTRKDKRQADLQIDLLFARCDVGNA
jgi:hypothetical protein